MDWCSIRTVIRCPSVLTMLSIRLLRLKSMVPDPLRWYMITNSSPWDNLKFDVDGIEEVRRKFFGTLYNTYSFFALYANVDGFEYKGS